MTTGSGKKLNNFLLKILCIQTGIVFTFSAPGIAKEVILTSKQASEASLETNAKNAENRYWIIYDNVCPYCKNATKHIKTLDWEKKFRFLSYRSPLTYKKFPSLTKEDCEKDVHMVTPKGEILVGYEVFRAIIDNLTATKILNPLLQNNYAESKLNEIYEKMVKERSCYYNKSDSCSLKAKKNPDKELDKPKDIETQ